MWSGGHVSLFALALNFLGAAHIVSTTSLQNVNDIDPVQSELVHQNGSEADAVREKRSIEQLIGPFLGNAVSGGINGVAAGSTINNILTPAPIMTKGADGTTTALQVVLLVMTPPAAPTQCNTVTDLKVVDKVTTTISTSVPQPPTANVYLPPTSRPTSTPKPLPFTPKPPTEVSTRKPIKKRPSPLKPHAQKPETVKVTQTPTPATKPAPKPAPTPAPATTTTPRLLPTLPPPPKHHDSPTFPPVKDSKVLVKEWRAQKQKRSLSPPILTQAYGDMPTYNKDELDWCLGTSETRDQLVINYNKDVQTPPQPVFDRSIMLKGILTVDKAGYSEKYTMWWDVISGAWRMDYHMNTSSTYNSVRRDGQLQSILVRMEQVDQTYVPNCVVLTSRRATLADRGLPLFPDITKYKFAGYMGVVVDKVPTTVERWVYETEDENETREQLTYRAELIIKRGEYKSPLPVCYTVGVDSSILGKNIDNYAHRFLTADTKYYDPKICQINLREVCETYETSDRPDDTQPLREFALLHRNPQHEKDFQEYKQMYKRQYADAMEEAVRKNILIQAKRFVSSANREGASFDVEINFLSDRTEKDKEYLFGTKVGGNNDGKPFAYSPQKLEAYYKQLPRIFDWRKHGAVSPVGDQRPCQGCWAVATAAAIEGALFKRTGRLVPLSSQSIIDCADEYNGHGCERSWPYAAYDYVLHNGLPAVDEYTPWSAEKQNCKAKDVAPVTFIKEYVNITSRDYRDVMVAIWKYGPIVVMVDANLQSFISYRKKVYEDRHCRTSQYNHAMLAVGWIQEKGQTVLILKNSWSTAWGKFGGYMYLRADTNTCGVLGVPSFPIIEKENAKRIPQSAPAGITPPPCKK